MVEFDVGHIMKKIILVVWTSVFVFGCAEDEPLTVKVRNQGAVCVAQNPVFLTGTDVSIEADEPTQIGVLIRSCSSTCIEELETSCSYEYDASNSTISVTSQASWRPEAVDVCNNACLVIDATCEGPTLPEGEYTVVHGENEQTLTVPSTYQCALSYP